MERGAAVDSCYDISVQIISTIILQCNSKYHVDVALSMFFVLTTRT